MKKKIITTSTVLLAIIGALFFYRSTLTPEINTTQLDYYFETLNDNNKFMGGVAVLKEGELIYSKNVGFSDYENKIEAEENTKYRIGSTSKTFTAVLVLKAVEEGKLSLDDKLAKFFPDVVNAKDIKIEYLLNHRSGVYSVTSEPDFLDWRTEHKTRAEILDIIKSGTSQFKPNSKAYYSNSNYILLTYILEDVYGKSYNEILKEKITKPLLINNTYLDDKIDTANRESKSYKFVVDWEADLETDTSIPLGAGGMVSTTVDLTKFINALFNGGILERKTVEKMATIMDTVGLGLFETRIDGKVAYEHPGVIDGFRANYIYIPEDEVIYAFTTNGLNYEDKLIQKTVMDAIYNKPIEVPEFSPPYEVTSEDLDKYLGVYTSPDVHKLLKITIGKNGNVLTAQGTMQDLFPATSVDKNKFRIGAIGANFEFIPEEEKIIWIQNGHTSIWTRE